MQIPKDWMNDPSLKDISKIKLDFLSMLFEKGSNLSQKEMMPFLMSLSKQSKDENIAFEKDELQRILDVFKKHATQAEIDKINKAMNMMNKKQ